MYKVANFIMLATLYKDKVQIPVSNTINFYFMNCKRANTKCFFFSFQYILLAHTFLFFFSPTQTELSLCKQLIV